MVEGDDTSFGAITPTARIGNYVQISRKSFIVSDVQEAVDKAGRASEIAHQKVKHGKELKRDMEIALLHNTTNAAGDGATVAAQTRGVEGWCATNCLVGATTGAAPNPSTNTAPVAGDARAFTETLLLQAQQSAWQNGGKPTMLMVSPDHMTDAMAFDGNGTRFHKAESGELNSAYEVYRGPFGVLKLVPSHLMAGKTTAFLIDPKYWALRTLEPMYTEELARTGLGRKFHIVTSYALEASNEAASAQIRDLS